MFKVLWFFLTDYPPSSFVIISFLIFRSAMTFLTRQAFSKVFNQTPDDLDMAVLYDVSHNIAKVEVSK